MNENELGQNPLNVLLVEDVPAYISLLRRVLASFDIQVQTASNLVEGIQKAVGDDFDLVLLDLGLPDSQGLDTFTKFYSRCPDAPIVVLTGLDDENLARKILQLGGQDYLIKGPYLTQEKSSQYLLLRSIHYAIERKQVQDALRRERDMLEERIAERTAELAQANEQLRQELTERMLFATALRESEMRNQALLNAMPDTIGRLDRHGRVLDVKFPPEIELLVPPNVQIIGASLSRIVPEIAEEGMIHLEKALKSGAPQVFELEVGSGRQKRNVEIRFVVSGENEVLAMVRDVTARRQAEGKLKRYYERLDILRAIDRATLAVQSPEALAHVALRQTWRLVPHDRADFLAFNQKNERAVILASRSDGDTTKSGRSIPLEDLSLQECLQDGEPYRVNDLEKLQELSKYEKQLIRKGIRSYFITPLIAEGKLIGAISLGARDERAFSAEHVESTQEMGRQLALMLYNAQLFEEVREGRERLRYLAARLVSAQEDERQRISLELHDEAGQALTALKLNIALIQSELPHKFKGIHKQLVDAIHLTENTMDKIRALARNLRPPALDTVGLDQTLADYCRRTASQTGLQINYSGTELSDLPDHYQINLYRVLQEALTNVIKHAQASQVQVSLAFQDSTINLIVKDNGKGFHHLAQPSQEEYKGIGLLGMEERIQALGGKLTVMSSRGQGTVLVVQVPWREKT
jgi:signal transduction histidine kinase/DNA-binding response OmpR family regulator